MSFFLISMLFPTEIGPAFNPLIPGPPIPRRKYKMKPRVKGLLPKHEFNVS